MNIIKPETKIDSKARKRRTTVDVGAQDTRGTVDEFRGEAERVRDAHEQSKAAEHESSLCDQRQRGQVCATRRATRRLSTQAQAVGRRDAQTRGQDEHADHRGHSSKERERRARG